MKILDKLMMDETELEEKGPITIVAFGDSVTHGCVGPGEMDYETVYWNRLRKKLNQVRPNIPVNVINAGIGGITASQSLKRMEKEVFSYHTDLLIVCFGLNDVNGSLEEYQNALAEIFKQSKALGISVIFMTPNMLNTYVAGDVEEMYREYAHITAEMQNNGRMDAFMDGAVSVAREMEVPVCDCYAQWKELSKTQDTTMLLANRINHPTRDMHELFAENLFQYIAQKIV